METAPAEHPADVSARRHSRLSAVVFAIKRRALQARRWIVDRRAGICAASITVGDGNYPLLLAEHLSPLWTETAAAEQRLQFGKVQNLRVAVRRLNGATLPPNALFSFWIQIGPPTTRRGFVPGRELREGCLIPATGGGICQFSNALYAAALAANAEIVERHAHSRVVPNSAASAGRDATVAYNYVDLRFRFSLPVRIEAQLTSDTLMVRLWGQPVKAEERNAAPEKAGTRGRRLDLLLPTPNSCVSCGQEQCFRHEPASGEGNEQKGAAILVAQYSAVVKDYLENYDAMGDTLLVPLNGQRANLRAYNFPTTVFSVVRSAPWLTARQALASRLVRREAPAARRERRRRDVAALAALYDRLLRPDETHLIVEQELLPALWANGTLGGRTFDVLMSQMPLRDLQRHLDEAARRWPESKTLGDFRAPESDVRAESEALGVARHIITTHSELVALYGNRAKAAVSSMPQTPVSPTIPLGEQRKFVAFVGPTVGRKGCYELRAALRELHLPVMLIGRNLENPKFWDGIPRFNGASESDVLAQAAIVVQPSLWEVRPPTLLLRALDAGIPVIASSGCGLGGRAGVVTVPFGDAAALTAALCDCLNRAAIDDRIERE